MAKKSSSIGKTLKLLHESGYLAESVEKYNQYRKKHDLFNIIDVVALSLYGLVGVQAFHREWSEHIQKVTIDHAEATAHWLLSGNELWLFGWRKVLKKRGGKLRIWRPLVLEITTADLPPMVVASARIDIESAKFPMNRLDPYRPRNDKKNQHPCDKSTMGTVTAGDVQEG